MKQTLEKCSIKNILSMPEMIERYEIEVSWIEKARQISDVLTKAGVASSELPNMLSTSKMISL